MEGEMSMCNHFDGKIDYCKLYGLSQGDRIRVFSGGQLIGGGSYIRIEGSIIVWVDQFSNMNFTDLRVSSIRKVTGGCPIDPCRDNPCSTNIDL